MACIHTTIAEAVKDALNAAKLSQAFTATRVYVPELEVRLNADAIAVRVWPDPEGRSSKFETRGAMRRTYPVYVAVLRKCNVDDNAVVDAYMALLEEIEDLFAGKSLDGYTSAVCVSTEQVVAYAWESVRAKRQYTGVVKLTFLRVA